LVVDEAHQLEDIATQYFGVAFSNFRVDDLVHDAGRLLPTVPLEIERLEEASRALSHIKDRSAVFFAALSLARATVTATDARVRYTSEAMAECTEEGLALATAFDELERALDRRQPGADEALDEAIGSIVRRARDLRQDLRFLLRADDESFV